jgi:hypothetical protein
MKESLGNTVLRIFTPSIPTMRNTGERVSILSGISGFPRSGRPGTLKFLWEYPYYQTLGIFTPPGVFMARYRLFK